MFFEGKLHMLDVKLAFVELAFVGLTSWDASLVHREALLLTLSTFCNPGVQYKQKCRMARSDTVACKLSLSKGS